MKNKFIILGDTHFGVSNSSIYHHQVMAQFYTSLFQYIDDNKIKTILQLGDLFDVRKHVNTWTLNFFRETFLKPVIERNLHVYVLVGNHDIYYRESLTISSVREILDPFKDWFTIVDSPDDYVIHGNKFLLVPWICRDNHDLTYKKIKESTSDYCAGHFEFSGFELFKGQYAKSGDDHTQYKKFKTIYSGHYHQRSARDNVVYCGTPYQLTWADASCERGFYVFDNGHHEFVRNPHIMYNTLNYDQIDTYTESDVCSKYIKVVVNKQLTDTERDKLLDTLYRMHPFDIKLIEPKLSVSIDDPVVEGDVEQTTVDVIITDYVDSLNFENTNIDKNVLNDILLNLYMEASDNANKV